MGNCASGEDGDDPSSFRPKSMKGNLLREQRGRDVFKYYEVTKVLGEGSMGAVSAARKKESVIGGSAYKESERGVFSRMFGKKKSAFVDTSAASEHKKDYALKTIQLSRISDEFIEELRNEIDILRSLDHPNIVKAFEVFENKRQIYIVMESCSGGDLYARNPYSEKEAAKIVGKLLSAVAYMHASNVCHRDLKFENIMFENTKKNAEIKVIDFGLSKKFIPGKKMSEGVGTIYTMAPQVLQGVYTSQADLWSIGVITYMLLSSSKPFYARKRRYMIDKIMRCDYNFNGPGWKHVSKEGKSFVSALIMLNPKERLTAEQALDHRWLSTEFPLSDRRPPEDFMDDVHDNIVSYRDTSEFKKMALMVIAHKSSTAEIVQLRQAFDQYDLSNDGTVTLAEFQKALAKFNYSEEDIETMFESVDVDKSGTIHYTEFLAATLEVHGHIEEDRLAEAFDRLDADDTGYISKKNLRNMLGSDYTPELVDRLMQEADTNRDGQISFQEFLDAVRKQNNHNLHMLVQSDSDVGGSTSTELLTVSAKIPGGKDD